MGPGGGSLEDKCSAAGGVPDSLVQARRGSDLLSWRAAPSVPGAHAVNALSDSSNTSPCVTYHAVVQAYRNILTAKDLDGAFIAMALSMPSSTELIDQVRVVLCHLAFSHAIHDCLNQ